MSPTKPPPVIIVEDSDEDFDTVEEAVRLSGVSVDIKRAVTGGDSLGLLRGDDAIRPVVVVMDLNTPGTDGREALQTIKADPDLKIGPVVVLGTSSNPKGLLFCYKAGANAYHVKPVRYPDHLEVLVDLLHYWLNRVVPISHGVADI